MSQEIGATSSLIKRLKLLSLQKTAMEAKKQAKDKSSQGFPKSLEEPRSAGFLRSILEELYAGREYSDDKSFKTFTRLTRSLENFFSVADSVDRKVGERELKQGGLRRVDTDLRKLFKGLGIPPQLTKHFSRAMSDAMGQEGVEQVNFPLTGSKDLQMELQKKQSTYLASGAGSAVATEETNSFQLSAIQVRSLDLSLNLRTGVFSLARTQLEPLSVNHSNSATLASFTPGAETPETEILPAEKVKPVTESSEVTAMIQSDSTLLEISRIVKRSAIMQLNPATSPNDNDEAEEKLFAGGLDSLQQLVESLEKLTNQSKSIFEPLVQIRNLRIEHESGYEHLRFTVDAQSPIGLTAIDESGHSSTLYPRPDGSIGKQVEDTVNVTA